MQEVQGDRGEEENTVRWAVFPERKCRQPFTDDGLTDKACDLPELHPGPDASRASKASIERRLAWEREHPGWQSLQGFDDPFREVKP